MASYRLLLVTYHWPPFSGSGAARWTALVKYLRRAGHEVTVITTSAHGRLPSDGEHGVLRTADLAGAGALRRLLRRPPLVAHGGNSQDAAKPAPAALTRVLVPDSYVASWTPFAARAARVHARRRQVDCLITSSPPDSVHMTGLRLGSHRPAWVADLRDGWRFEPLRPAFPTRPQRRLDAWLERRVAERADALTAATRPIAEDLQDRLAAPATVVPNAWDPDLEREVEKAEPVPLADDVFAFVHTGTLSGGWGRDPRGLVQGLAALITDGPELRRRIRLFLAGQLREEDMRLFAQEGLADVVEHLGPIPHRRALALQRAAGALVLVTSPNVGEASGKLFEYLASRRPIIAIGGENEAARIVRETMTGVVVSPEDTEGIVAALGDAVAGRLEDAYSPHGLGRYTYPGPAETLAETIDVAIQRRRGAAGTR
jgi:glycosyltransferase involved in cell wall biosynthesis